MTMETSARISRPIRACVALVGAALIVSAVVAGHADSRRFSQKVIKSVSKQRLAGAYSGVTEQGTAVEFRLTRKGKIVDFVIPVTLSCQTDVDLDGDGTSSPGESTDSIKSTTLRSAPLRGRKSSPQYPFGTTFEYRSPVIPNDQPPPGTRAVEYSVKVKFDEGVGYNIFRPVPKRAAAMNGEVYMSAFNGPLGYHAPGIEGCVLSDDGQKVTHINALDFDAKETGR
jgi:hypothetical protein